MPRLTLEQIRIAEPCHASWERMRGDARARFCDDCRKHVYDLSAMTRAEADALLARHAETRPPCVQFVADADGSPLTRDQLSPLTRWLHRHRRWWAAAAAIGFVANLVGCRGAVAQSNRTAAGSPVPIQRTMGIVAQPPTTAPTSQPQ